MICHRCLSAARVGWHTREAASAFRIATSRRLLLARFASSAPSSLPLPTPSAARDSPRSASTTRCLPPSAMRRSYSTTPPPSEQTLPLERPSDMTDGEAAVWDLLSAELAPTQLVVQDVSGGCGSMYSIDITSEKFRGLNMVKQQRVVNALLADMVKEWHGLQLRTRTP